MKFQWLLLLTWLLLISCQNKRTLEQFSQNEFNAVSLKIGQSLTQNKPEILTSLVGLSQITDSTVALAKNIGLSDYQLNVMGLESPKIYNQILKDIFIWICYYSGIEGNVVLSKEQFNHDNYSLSFVYSTPNGFFEILEFELITNGYQLFIGDINLIHKNMKLSELIYKNIASPGYSENLKEFSKDLEKAVDAARSNEWERAEYFYSQVPQESLYEPQLLEYSIAATNMLDPIRTLPIFNNVIAQLDDKRAKIYWQLRKEIFFEETDSLETLTAQLEALINKNKVTQEFLTKYNAR